MALRTQEFLTENQIIAELSGADVDAVLGELADNLAAAVGLSATEIKAALLAREKLSSTGIGGGVAIPHAKFSTLDRVVVCFARSPGGVAYAAIDKQPVKLFFALLSPEKMTAVHLKVLAKIAGMVRKVSFKEQLLSCGSATELYQTILAEDGGR